MKAQKTVDSSGRGVDAASGQGLEKAPSSIVLTCIGWHLPILLKVVIGFGQNCNQSTSPLTIASARASTDIIDSFGYYKSMR